MEGLLSFSPGETIIEEGIKDERLFVLQSGEVEVRKGGSAVCTISESNTVFGELSSILARPRTCSVVAVTGCEVAVIGNSIDEVITKSPILTRSILQEMADRLERTTSQLVGQGLITVKGTAPTPAAD